MKPESSIILWSARLLALAIGVFLALFAVDEWTSEKPPSRALTGVVLHLLPSAAMLAVVVLSWRRQWIGGLVFVALAVAYAVIVRFRLDWVLAISGPLLAAGLLFLWSWMLGRMPKSQLPTSN
jgi:hypothetical protein